MTPPKNNLPQQKRDGGSISAQTRRTESEIVHQFHLQFPSAVPEGENLAKVEAICPGFAETLRSNFDANSQFSRDEKRETRKSNTFERRERLYIALVVFLVFVALACYALSLNYPYVALGFLGLPLTGAVALFIANRKDQPQP